MTHPNQTRLLGELLQTERLSNGRRRLLRDFAIEVEGICMTIPADTHTDFSTIPWFGRALVRWSRVDIAGVVHDWLYQTATYKRARADRMWRLVAMAGEHRANPAQAWIGWFALRIGGWIAWRQHRR